ncbi:MAG TPA: DUF2017 family protein [Kiritimatiellia bacterium]|nr:DUF2017 family protein [Kiritimatiellia bacterium]
MIRVERVQDGTMVLRFAPGEGRIVVQTARRLHAHLTAASHEGGEVPAWLALKAWNLPGLKPEDQQVLRGAILEQKRKQMDVFMERLGTPLTGTSEIRLQGDEVEAFLGAVNDLRLMLADMMGVEEDLHEPPPRPEHAGLHQLLLFLGAYQQMILEAGYGLGQEADWSDGGDT